MPLNHSRYYDIYFAAFCGVVLALLAYSYITDFITENKTRELKEKVSVLTVKLQDEIKLEAAMLDNMATVLSIEPEDISEAHFNDVAHQIIHDNPAITDLYAVNNDEHDALFKIAHHYPMAQHTDIAHQRTLIQQLIKTTPAINKLLINNASGSLISDDLQNIIVYKPVHTQFSSIDTDHYLIAAINLEKQFSEIITATLPEWLDVDIFLGNQTAQLLHLFGTSKQGLDPEEIGQTTSHSLFVPGSVNAHGLSLSLLYQRNDQNYWQHLYQHSIAPGIVLLITLAICLYLYSQHQWADNTSRLIEERTQELTEAKNALTDEAQARVKTLKQLSASEQELRNLMHSIEGIIWETGRDLTTLLYVSPQITRILGYKPDELKAEGAFAKNIHPDDIETYNNSLKSAVTDKEKHFVECEYRYLNSNEEIVWMKSVISIVRNPDGKAINLRGVSMDVTKFREALMENEVMEAQMRQTQKMEAIGQLAAGIAHEINTPTQFVGDNIHFLNDAFGDFQELIEAHRALVLAVQEGKPTEELVARIESVREDIDSDTLLTDIPDAINQSLEGTERISSIVRAMKEFSHPGSSDKKAIDLNSAIENTITVARNEWKYVADIDTQFDDTLPLVTCLAGEVNQVILNIIVNAAHAIADRQKKEGHTNHGQITIVTQALDNQVAIKISDTGSGIPKDHLEQIFNPFFTTKEVGKGTGQGLSIAYQVITEKHQGQIKVDSIVDEGTTFTILMPVSMEDAPEMALASNQ